MTNAGIIAAVKIARRRITDVARREKPMREVKKMKYCKDYFSAACEHCPEVYEDCDKCFYNRGCSTCITRRYGLCPEGKTDEGKTDEGGEKK